MSLLDTLPLEIENMIYEFKGTYKYNFEEHFEKHKTKKVDGDWRRYFKRQAVIQPVIWGLSFGAKGVLVGLGLTGGVLIGATVPVVLVAVAPVLYLTHKRVNQRYNRQKKLVKNRFRKYCEISRFLNEVDLYDNSRRQRELINDN